MVKGNGVQLSRSISDRKLFGCRRRVNGKCVECKDGYYQANPEHNDDCAADPMFNCHTMLDDSTCSCRADSMTRYKTNKFCDPLVKDDVGDQNYNLLVNAHDEEVYDQCARVNALYMLFCNKFSPLDGNGDVTSGTTLALKESLEKYMDNVDAFLSSGTNPSGYHEQTWTNFKLQTGDIMKQEETWRQLGIVKDQFCLKSFIHQPMEEGEE